MLGRENCIGSISEDICKVHSGSTQVITWFYVRNQTSSNSQRSPISKNIKVQTLWSFENQFYKKKTEASKAKLEVSKNGATTKSSILLKDFPL